MRHQGFQDTHHPVHFETLFLLIQPEFRRVGTAWGRFCQVFTKVHEINQVVTLTAKLFSHLVLDPSGAIANRMQMGLSAEIGLQRTIQ